MIRVDDLIAILEEIREMCGGDAVIDVTPLGDYYPGEGEAAAVLVIDEVGE